MTPWCARADLAGSRLHDLDDVLRDLDADAAALEAEHKPPVARTSR